MGYDKTPSADRRILILGIVSIGTLVLLMPLLRSYFFSVIEPLDQQRVIQTGHSQLDAYRREQERATGTVNVAIETLGQRGRVASTSIAPRREETAQADAVEGWAEMKNENARRAAERAFELGQQARLAQEAAMADGGVAVPHNAPGAP